MPLTPLYSGTRPELMCHGVVIVLQSSVLILVPTLTVQKLMDDIIQPPLMRLHLTHSLFHGLATLLLLYKDYCFEI